MTGFPLIIAFIVAIVFMIVAISKFKIHPLQCPSHSPAVCISHMYSFRRHRDRSLRHRHWGLEIIY